MTTTMTRCTFCVAALAALAVMAALARTADAEPVAAPLATPTSGRAILTMTGPDSAVTKPSYRLAASQEIFDQLWLEHLGDDPPREALGQVQSPQIDFETVVAIFIFGGNSIRTTGYLINEVIYEDDAITVRFECDQCQPVLYCGSYPGDETTPWALVLIPATGKTVFLEEKITALPDQPMVAWKQQAVFPGRIGIGRTVGGTRQTGETPQP